MIGVDSDGPHGLHMVVVGRSGKRAEQRGRGHVQAWPAIVRGTVSKNTAQKQGVDMIRSLAPGTMERVAFLRRRQQPADSVPGTVPWNEARTPGEPDASFSPGRPSPRGSGSKQAAGRRSLQLVLAASRRLPTNRTGERAQRSHRDHACPGCWPHRSSLEHPRGAHVSDGSAARRGSEAALSPEEPRTEDVSSVCGSTTPFPSRTQGGLLCLHQRRVPYPHRNTLQ
jgi:hypothetical protein